MKRQWSRRRPNVISIKDIMKNYRPGSYDEPWEWRDELKELRKRNELSIPFGQRSEDFEPVLLGDDGRVWDGHHRILAALRSGARELRVEYGSE